MSYSDKYNLAYTVQGKGTCIVLLHGFCEDGSMWDEVIANGIDGLKVITIDLPGFGKSPITSSFSIEDFGTMVLQLLEEIGVETYYLFGHSMGGYIALSMVEKNAKGILGLGLLHSHPFADNEAGKINRQKAADFIAKYGSTLYIKQVIPALFPKSFITSNRFLLEKLVFDACNYPTAGISNALIAMKNRPNRQAILEKMTIPFLAVIGEKDELLATDQLLKQASLAPTTQVELIKNCGHMGPFEQPKLLNKILHRFIQNFQRES